jgi:hypothetical protein
MADELSDYLQGAYLDERRDIERLKETGSKILNVFDHFFLQAEGVWPYEVVDGQDIPSSVVFSFSTNAMIVFALAVATGRISRSELLPAIRQAPVATRSKAQLKSLEESMKNALGRFPSEIDLSRGNKDELEKWIVGQEDRSRPTDVSLATTSASFGPNDPLTLTWLLEVLGEGTPAEPNDRDRLLKDLVPVAQEIVTSEFEDPGHSPLRLPFYDLVPHAFTLLRVLHLFNTEGLRTSGWQPAHGVDRVHEFFLNRAHFHLSSTSVQNGGFDAGELVFSLEGLLLCDPSLPDYSLFDRAFEVLVDRQRETPYWRPLRPFRVTRQGMILLPQSVEIANSLLRICSRLDESRDRSYFSDYVDLFKAYTRWLESRMFIGKTKNQNINDIVGWQSEHTFAPNRIHLWQTSQVLLYLMHYAAMLQRHIAQRSFRAARFSVTSAPSPSNRETGSWDKLEESEPMRSLSKDGPYAVYHRIGDSIVRPRLPNVRPDPEWSSSALLYGPPGTGKSRIAKEIAKTLRYPLITITPSDFISAGQEAAEARAKNIFATLMEQTDLVILFDEVDQLLLDRDSVLYREQGDIFKLITPGMLTKLNDLTERKEVVFVVATNFFERIDPAIKRPGRIDERLLVLPPDAGQRMRFLSEGAKGKGPLFAGWETLGSKQKTELVNQLALYSYGELRDLAKRLGSAKADGDALKENILSQLLEFPPTISVASYKYRVGKWREGLYETDEEGPFKEFVMVVYIAAESEQVNDSDRSWVEGPLTRAWISGAVSREQERVWEVLERAGLLKLESV